MIPHREQSEVRLHPHARDRIAERGATEPEVIMTVRTGEPFEVRHGRAGFRRNVAYDGMWRGKLYANKQIEAIAVFEDGHWLVLTVLVKFF